MLKYLRYDPGDTFWFLPRTNLSIELVIRIVSMGADTQIHISLTWELKEDSSHYNFQLSGMKLQGFVLLVLTKN